MMKVRPQTAGT